MNIHALRSFFFSSKRPDYPYLAVTQAPTPKNPLVKRWRRSRISRSRPHEHINLGLPFKRESRDLKQLTFVKAAATITHEVAWIDNGVHRPSHRIWHSPVTSKTGVWVLVSQSTIVALQLCPQMNSLWQCFFLT